MEPQQNRQQTEKKPHQFCPTRDDHQLFDHVGLAWKKHVVVDKALFRPAEVNTLCGDPAKARRRLGWKPDVDFPGLVRMMVDADLKRLS